MKVYFIALLNKPRSFQSIKKIIYRPISVLSVSSKIVEKLVYDRMISFLETNNLISNCQHGFRTKKSTLTAACNLLECIHTELDRGMQVAGLFFDLTRAFDCLDIKFIKSKLYNIGFRGIFLDWMVSYLSNRKISVKIKDSISESFDMNMGVPQGSVLGPLIFLLFINDLPEYTKSKILVLYADDTSLVVSAQTSEKLLISIQDIICKFIKWCKENGLMINIEKTQLLYFHSNNILNNSYSLTVNIDKIQISSTATTKFLGLHIDSNLRWTDHINSVNKKLNQSFYAISRLRNNMPTNALLNVYYSLVYSHLSYNTILWGNSTESNKIFVTQKKILRNIFFMDDRESCKPVFIKNRIMSFHCIYIYHCLLYVKQHIDSYELNCLNHCYLTRNSNNIRIPLHKTSKIQHSFRYMSLKLYNTLPVNIKNINSFTAYKNTIKDLLMQKCYYSVQEFFDDFA